MNETIRIEFIDSKKSFKASIRINEMTYTGEGTTIMAALNNLDENILHYANLR
jgi:hypothetical protein